MPADLPRYDVALSYAGEQRPYVERVATRLAAHGISHYYDRANPTLLWGKNLVETLQQIYEKDSASVVLFVSAEYAEKQWTRHERRAALSRAVREARTYVLPARFDDTELPGLVTDVVYAELGTMEAEVFADEIVRWLRDNGIV